MMPGTLEQVSNMMSSWHHGAKGMQQTVFWGTGSHRCIGLARAVISHICTQDAVIASVRAVGLGNLSLEGHACKRSEEENAHSLQHMGSEAFENSTVAGCSESVLCRGRKPLPHCSLCACLQHTRREFLLGRVGLMKASTGRFTFMVLAQWDPFLEGGWLQRVACTAVGP